MPVKAARWACLAVLLVLGGCAQQPTVMRYFPAGEEGTRVWPSPPEVPRYRFAGELIGEGNFGPAEQSTPGTGERFLRWLVGLGQERREPRTLIRPQTGMVDGSGRIFVTDVGRQGVLVFDPVQGKLLTWDEAGAGRLFRTPVGIAAGRAGEVLVADAQLGYVVRLDAQGKPLGRLGEGWLERPTGLARDPGAGRLYVVDTAAHDIKVMDDDGRHIAIIGRRGNAPGELNGPTHITFAQGRLYVADTLNARVQVLTPDGQPLAVIGRRGLYVGNLTRPKGVAVDHDGNIYIVESYYDHLLVFSPEGRLLLPIGGSGAAVGQFYLPAGAWMDAGGRVFVADMFNGRVVIFQYLGE